MARSETKWIYYFDSSVKFISQIYPIYVTNIVRECLFSILLPKLDYISFICVDFIDS